LKNKYLTLRGEMVTIAVLAAILALIASELWRWGYPRRLPFRHDNALSWMATVTRSDFRMYDGNDVYALLIHVASSGLLIGKTREQVVESLGVPSDWASPPPVDSDGKDVFFSVGTLPNHIFAGPPTLFCRFDDTGNCVQVTAFGSW
jgi:hypothetical protein